MEEEILVSFFNETRLQRTAGIMLVKKVNVLLLKKEKELWYTFCNYMQK
jgi:hypothetical protein